jgi:alpha-glucosidase
MRSRSTCKDPEAIANWPLTLSRDGVRTPMPWLADAPNGGFARGRRGCRSRQATSPVPWMRRRPIRPPAAFHATGSRPARGHRALHHGAIDHIRAQGDLLSFTRRVDGEAIHCAFNIGGQRHTHKCPVGDVLLAVNEPITATSLHGER